MSMHEMKLQHFMHARGATCTFYYRNTEAALSALLSENQFIRGGASLKGKQYNQHIMINTDLVSHLIGEKITKKY